MDQRKRFKRGSRVSVDHLDKPALDKPSWHKTNPLDTSKYVFTLLCVLHLKSTEPREGIHHSLRFEACCVSFMNEDLNDMINRSTQCVKRHLVI